MSDQSPLMSDQSQKKAEIQAPEVNVTCTATLRKEFGLLPKRKFLSMLDRELFREWHVLTYHWLNDALVTQDKDEAYFLACVQIYARAKLKPANGEMVKERMHRVINGGAVFKKDDLGQWSYRLSYKHDPVTGDVTYHWVRG